MRNFLASLLVSNFIRVPPFPWPKKLSLDWLIVFLVPFLAASCLHWLLYNVHCQPFLKLWTLAANVCSLQHVTAAYPIPDSGCYLLSNGSKRRKKRIFAAYVEEKFGLQRVQTVNTPPMQLYWCQQIMPVVFPANSVWWKPFSVWSSLIIWDRHFHKMLQNPLRSWQLAVGALSPVIGMTGNYSSHHLIYVPAHCFSTKYSLTQHVWGYSRHPKQQSQEDMSRR